MRPLKNILLLDDEVSIHDIWKRFHDVAEPVFRGQLALDVAVNLEQGLKRMEEKKYDALIFDLTMPPLSQDEVIQFIQNNASHLPIISVLTGDEDIYVRRRCILAGAADFWLKNDAHQRPDLFFKSLYNEYLKRYVTESERHPTSS